MANIASSKVNEYLDKHFDIQELIANYEFGYLQRTLEACFLLDLSDLVADEKAEIILQAVFSRLVKDFSFPIINNKKIKRLSLTRLLFSIYAQDFTLDLLQNKEVLSHYLFQLEAACSSKAHVAAIWKKLSPSKKSAQLAFSQAHFDEGAFAICKAAKQLKSQAPITSHEVRDLQRLLQPYTKASIRYSSVKKFVKIFGLYGHQVPESLQRLVQENTSLIQKLEAIQTLDENDVKIFVERILLHIEALSDHPEWYKNGLNLLVHALPTCGKDLSKLYWLESTAASIHLMNKQLKGIDHPIFVFDQSEDELFLKNAAYIKRLKKRYKIAIVHLDTSTIIRVAKVLKLEHFIVTSTGKNFGYSGARNAIFLIAPLLHKIGTKKIASLSDDEIRTFGKMPNDVFVHMGDDDVFAPPSLIFCDALWAHLHKDEFCSRMGSVVGRFARDSSFTKNDVLYATSKILSHCPWIKTAFTHGMACLISKPKLCLNLPFGQEENHMLAITCEFFDFRPIPIHLAGPRYPKVKKIPESIFCGLGDFLKTRYVDIVQRLLVTELLDPSNRYNQCVLVWNLKHDPFTSFQEMMEYISNPKTQALMKKKFWENFKRALNAFFQNEEGIHLHSSQALSDILKTNWDKEFLHVMPKTEALALRTFYKEFTLQASIYKEFMSRVDSERLTKSDSQAIEDARLHIESVHNTTISNLPLAYTLYLFCKSVGAGGFQ